jgi:hypothetical protein
VGPSRFLSRKLPIKSRLGEGCHNAKAQRKMANCMCVVRGRGASAISDTPGGHLERPEDGELPPLSLPCLREALPPASDLPLGPEILCSLAGDPF